MKKRKRTSYYTGQKRRKTSKKKEPSIKVEDVTNSRLLALPAELREYIYKLVLTEDEDIVVTATLKEPYLISLNRQIRREARNTWYRSNFFLVDIVGCNDRPLSEFFTHCKHIKMYPEMKLRVDPTQKSWTDLLRWCKNIWDGVSRGYAKGQDMRGVNVKVVAAAAHEIVSQHMVNKRSWSECEAALQSTKKVVQMYDPAWK